MRLPIICICSWSSFKDVLSLDSTLVRTSRTFLRNGIERKIVLVSSSSLMPTSYDKLPLGLKWCSLKELRMMWRKKCVGSVFVTRRD